LWDVKFLFAEIDLALFAHLDARKSKLLHAVKRAGRLQERTEEELGFMHDYSLLVGLPHRPEE
jgi:hypothetical protein